MVANSQGILVRCPEIVTAVRVANRCKYHSTDCQQWTNARRARGFTLGDFYVRWGRGKRWRERRGLPPDPRASLGRCIGMIVDSNHILIQCSETVPAGETRISYGSGRDPRYHSRAYLLYHSKECYMFTLRRRRLGYVLGDPYLKWSRTKRHAKLCEGWTIRDGIIATCSKPFTAGTTLQKHHSLACMYQTRRWRKIGYRLGESVRRTCAYRNCSKGEGGSPGTFDRIRHRKGDVDYWCDGRCAAAEQRAREAERVAEIVAKAERVLATRGGREKKKTIDEIVAKIDACIPRARLIFDAAAALPFPKGSDEARQALLAKGFADREIGALQGSIWPKYHLGVARAELSLAQRLVAADENASPIAIRKHWDRAPSR